MSRMRGWVAALAAGALLLSGCAGGETETEPPENTNTAPAPSDEPTEADPTSDPGTGTETPAGDPETTAPAQELTEEAMPTADDLEWHEPGDWQIDDTEDDPTADLTDTCQQGEWADTGTEQIIGRSYLLTDGDPEFDRTHAVVLQYDDEEAARTAYETIRGWTRDCADDDVEGIPNAQTPVEVSEGEAEFSEWTKLDESGQFGVFSMIGVTQRENRVAWVVMEIAGQDNSWDYEEGGEVGALHPMIRSLPKVNERLG